MAMGVMVIIGGVVAGLASAVFTSDSYNQGVANVTQHGRVALERMANTVRTATASEDFPGCAVLEVLIDGSRVADTLVVWHPTGAPVNASGPPLARELVIYAPDASDPRQLLEITPASSDTRPMPSPNTEYVTWVSFIEGIKKSSSSTRTVLTDLLRVSALSNIVSGSGNTSRLRGAAHFECRPTPSAADWAAYRGGSVAWANLSWPQGLYGSKKGVRHVAVTMELQLMPTRTPAGEVSPGSLAHPMFGSSTLSYELSK